MNELLRKAVEAVFALDAGTDFSTADEYAMVRGEAAEAAIAYVRTLAQPAAAGDDRLAWRDIATMPDDDRLVLAQTDDGRSFIYRACILARNLRGPTPHHLQFPAVRWMPIPPADLPAGKVDCPICEGDGWVDSASSICKRTTR